MPYKAHLCAQRGRGCHSTRERQHSNYQTQPPPSPGSPDLGRLLSLERTLTPSREAWAGGAMGDWGNNYCHHEKKADSREREGRGQRGHVTSGVRVQGLPAHSTKGRGRPNGTNETCHRGVSQWSTEAAWLLRNVRCCALPHGTRNPDRNVHPKSLISECKKTQIV